MTPLESPSSAPSVSLPLLTELADDAALEALPTLTEVVATAAAAIPDAPPTHTASASPAADNLPVLLESVGISYLPDVPVESTEKASGQPAPVLLSEVQLQQLEQQLTHHLESVLRNKLSLRLEQLQKLALDQALSELKTELPMLLRDVLSKHLESR